LWYEQIEKGFESSLWMGFHQGAKAGGSVRKGEKGTSILRMNTIKDDNGDVKCVLPATAVVFNLDQFNGLDELKPTFTQHQWTPIESAEALLSSTGAIIEYGGDKAFYRKSDDKIRLPERSRFHDESGFYATAIHELGHWTGHSSRLDRDTKGKYGSEAYAFVELVADIASAITQARIGLHADIEGHASYVESWLKCLQQDQRAILKASSLAQKASDFLLRKNNEHPQE
jgi:antirestriction protein ArdC